MPKGRGMANLLRNVEQQMNEEHDKQDRILRAAALIAMHRHWGWRQKRLLGLLEMIDEVISECGETNKKSMIQMLDEETGIELQNGDGKSWKELAFLNAEIDIGKLTLPKLIYMRQQELKWIPTLIIAYILLALHRKCGFGSDRCTRVYTQIMETAEEFVWSGQKLTDACRLETGIDIDKVHFLREVKDGSDKKTG